MAVDRGRGIALSEGGVVPGSRYSGTGVAGEQCTATRLAGGGDGGPGPTSSHAAHEAQHRRATDGMARVPCRTAAALAAACSA